MELSNNDIAQIESYLDGTLTAEEVQAFETRMQQEPDFASEVDIYLDVIEGLKAGGRSEVKANVAMAGAAVIASGNLQEYTPSLSEEGSTEVSPSRPKSSFGRRLLSIIFLGAAIAGFYMWYTDQIPEEWLKFFKSDRKVKSDTIKNETQQEEYIKIDTVISRDTIYHESAVDEHAEAIEVEDLNPQVYSDAQINPSEGRVKHSDTGLTITSANNDYQRSPEPEPAVEFELEMAY